MKKYILLVIVILGIFSFLPRGEKKVLRVGVECDHEPYNWEEKVKSETNFPLVNNQGFYTEGYDVQIAALVAEKLGMKVEFKKVKWEDLINSLMNHEIDAIFSGMVDTDERKKSINFTVPYEINAVEYAVLLSDQSAFTRAETLEDLTGARILAQKDSRFDEVIDQIPRVKHLKPLETKKEIIDEVINFRVDGTVLNYDTGLAYETVHRGLRLIRFSENEGFELGFTGLCAGVRKTDEELLERMNNAIDGISKKERQRIMDRALLGVWKN